MEPLTHARCVLIKLHGDYRDTRIKNTFEELSSYAPAMDGLLDRILDEYGLVVCGWSAIWDPALRAAIERTPTRRYSTFWACKGEPTEEAKRLIEIRDAKVVNIDSADAFFQALDEKILSIETIKQPHPLSMAEAVASLKRYLVEDRYRIRLQDLVADEVTQQLCDLGELDTPFTTSISAGQYIQRLDRYEKSMHMLIALLAHGCFYGNGKHNQIWGNAIKLMSELDKRVSGSEDLIKLQLYPSCLLFFAAGVAAVAGDNFAAVRFLLREARLDRAPMEARDEGFTASLVPGLIIRMRGSYLDRIALRNTPASDRVFEVLREPLRALISSDQRYDACFERWEYLLTLVYFDHPEGEVWAPIGRFGWISKRLGGLDMHVSTLLAKENQALKEEWAPIKAGLFANSATFQKLNNAYIEKILSKM